MTKKKEGNTRSSGQLFIDAFYPATRDQYVPAYPQIRTFSISSLSLTTIILISQRINPLPPPSHQKLKKYKGGRGAVPLLT